MRGLSLPDELRNSGLGASCHIAFFVALIPKDIPGSFCEF